MRTKQIGSTKRKSMSNGPKHATSKSGDNIATATLPISTVPEVSPLASDVVKTVYMDIHDVLAVHGVLATQLGISTHDIIALFDNLETMKWDTSKRHGPLMALLTTGLIRARSRS